MMEMETVQYIGESGGGCGVLIIGIIGILIALAWNGTLSESAQRRNDKRGEREE